MTNEKNQIIKNSLTPEQVRSIGISLNNGKPYGWRDNLADITGASAYTIRSWVDAEESAAHRSCTGPAARLLLILNQMNERGVDVRKYLADVLI